MPLINVRIWIQSTMQQASMYLTCHWDIHAWQLQLPLPEVTYVWTWVHVGESVNSGLDYWTAVDMLMRICIRRRWKRLRVIQSPREGGEKTTRCSSQGCVEHPESVDVRLWGWKTPSKARGPRRSVCGCEAERSKVAIRVSLWMYMWGWKKHKPRQLNVICPREFESGTKDKKVDTIYLCLFRKRTSLYEDTKQSQWQQERTAMCSE